LSLKTGISTELSGGYRAGYERGYQHGYQDAFSGLGYENVAEFHGAEAYGPYGEGMHEGEHAGYEAGFRAGFGRHHRHRHPGFFQSIFGMMMVSVDVSANRI
jgi:hypothetical protein